MDSLSIAASVITLTELTGACPKIGKKFFEPSVHSSSDLKELSLNLYGINGTLKNLQTYLEVHEEDHTRLQALDRLYEPLKYCKEALTAVEEILKGTNFSRNAIVGASFDTKLKKSLRTIDPIEQDI